MTAATGSKTVVVQEVIARKPYISPIGAPVIERDICAIVIHDKHHNFDWFAFRLEYLKTLIKQLEGDEEDLIMILTREKNGGSILVIEYESTWYALAGVAYD